MYDFLLNNAQGYHTTANIIPILLGASHESLKKIIDKLNKNNKADNNAFKYIQEHSLYKFYERLGYVTALDWDTAKDNFNNFIGKTVYTDHAPLDFWRAARRVFRYDDFSSTLKCFGDKNHHTYLLNYLNGFNINYRGYNRFGYFHISIGHEWSGLNIRTLDKNLVEFFTDFFKENNADEDFVLMITGDHGRAITEWDLYIEGLMENELPIHLLITNKNTINRFGLKAHENLRYNSKRLVSRSDWYVTLKHLAIFPYGNLDISSDTYKAFKNESLSMNAASLFLEKIPDNRMCEDVNIEKSICSCISYDKMTSEVVKETSKMALNKTIELINASLKEKALCNKITIKNVLSLEEFILKEDETRVSYQIRLNFTIIELPNIRFEAILHAAEKNCFKEYIVHKKVNTPRFELELVTKQATFESYLQVLYIDILDQHECKYSNSILEFNSPK